MAARRWGVRALTLALACALLAGLGISALAFGEPDQGEVVNPVTPQPTVTIQGNLVTENGKPTGFYELALCVQSGYDYRRITPQDDDKDVISKEDYALLSGDEQAGYAPYYYPFRTVSAAMYINTDVLTPVSWDLSSVRYESFDGAKYDQLDDAYPRGIDPDPAVQGYDMDQKEAFPDITTANLDRLEGLPVSVALDVEGDTRMTTVEGMAQHYDEENHAALITLSAHAPDNYSVTLRQSTPVVVARFAYDLKRFSATKVLDTGDSDSTEAQRNSLTGKPSEDGFWMGWDKTSWESVYSAKAPLTWLGQSETTTAQDFTKSDAMIAETAGHQSVWVHMGTGAADAAQQDTYFYYYLAADGTAPQISGTESVLVAAGGDAPESVPGVAIPKTAGERVLTPGESEYNEQTLPEPPEYNFFDNLLTLGKKTLVLELVNQPSFRKPTGGYGGNQILFYDWDDKLIGALIVGDGDVRAQVNAYVEQNFIHPDLRAGEVLSDDLGGELPDFTADTTDYTDLVSSLDRDYTYRGKYAYQVGGDNTAEGRADGPEYPLTNKLDYVFTKRVNTVVTQTDDDGNETRYVHPYTLDDPALAETDAALYPYVYGWAVVEDTAGNGRVDASGDADGTWKTMHDAAKLEDTWTTFGTGELSGMKRADMAKSLSAFTADPAAAYSAPAFLAESDPTWTDGTHTGANDYLYQLSGESGYLRFADFSDITAEMARCQDKNTLIVKAVYEEGAALLSGRNYTLVTEPAYSKWNTKSAAAGGSYKAQLTMERSYNDGGTVKGTTRVRTPAIRQDNTIDYKWLSDEERDVLNDMDNADLETARGETETMFTKVDYDNGESVTFSLALSARHNRVDYRLTEQYGLNFVFGTQRSDANTDILNTSSDQFVLDNYNYTGASIGDNLDDYYDCDFATKDGSRGFVLLGTLGHFLEQATRVNHGEMTQLDYNDAVTFEIAQDANLRMDRAGTQPVYANNDTLRDAFLAAAKKCEEHKSDPAYDCWEENLDCAKLTYHQAQLFLLDYQADPACDIRTVSAADGETLPFCHYHVSCTGGHVPVPPRTWGELTAKMQEYREAGSGTDDGKNALADLSALDLNTLNTMTNLRTTDGARFSSASDFITALLAAEKALTDKSLPVNWVNLQYTLIHKTPGDDEDTMKTEAQTNYWWYSGANAAPRVNDFAALLAAAATARTPTTLPDGTSGFLPQSALAAAQFPAEAEAYLTSSSPTRAQRNAWVTLTDNLVPSHTETDEGEGDERYVEYATEKFRDMAEFLAAFNEAYDKVPEPKPADARAWWDAIQTAILQKEKPDDDLGAHNGDETTKFWWRGGNTPFKITNLTTLVEAARRLNAGDTESAEYQAAQKEWDRLTVAEIEGAEISQSLRWKGDDDLHPMYPYAAADAAADVFNKLSGADEDTRKAAVLTQLKSAVQRFDTAAADNPELGLTWGTIQYLLLNTGPVPEISVINAQAIYYWWRNGATSGTSISLLSNAKQFSLDANMQTLIEATYRADFNDPGVIHSLLAVADGGDGSKTFWSATRLITEKVQGTQFDRVENENDNYDGPDNEEEARRKAYPANSEDDARALLTALSEYRDARKTKEGVGDPYGMPSAVGWHYVQYYLLHKNEADPHLPAEQYSAMLDQEKALAGDYWWYFVDERVPPAPPASGEPSDEFRNGPLLTAVNGGAAVNVTQDYVINTMKMKGNSKGATPATAILKKIWANLVKDLQAKTDAAAYTQSLTWVQIQYYLASAYTAKPNGTAPGTLVDTPKEAYDGLVAMGFDPSTFPSGIKTAALSAPFEILPLEALDTADLLTKKAELERQLAQVEEQLAALEAAQTAQTAPSTSAPSRPSQTPSQPETPVEPETPIEPETQTQPSTEPETPATSKPSESTDTTAPSEPSKETDTPSPSKPSESTDTPAPSERPEALPGERAEVPVGSDVVLAGRAPAEAEAEQVQPMIRPALPGVSLLLALDLPLLAGGRGRRRRRRD